MTEVKTEVTAVLHERMRAILIEWIIEVHRMLMYALYYRKCPMLCMH
jgi:hypothetical protein